MRPFKFFFAAALGVLLFFFVAKFVVIAFLIALGLTLVFSVIRRVHAFVTQERWHDHSYYPEFEKQHLRDYTDCEVGGESLDLGWDRERDYLANYRRVEVL